MLRHNRQKGNRSKGNQDPKCPVPEILGRADISANERTVLTPVADQRNDGAGEAEVHQRADSCLESKRKPELRIGFHRQLTDEKQCAQKLDTLQRSLSKEKATNDA